MRREARKYLTDVERAADSVAAFTDGRDFEMYQADALLRSAVERQLEIIGEAMARLAQADSTVAEQVSDYRRISGLRNVLIHRYGDIDDRLVWDVVQTRVQRFREEVARLLEE